MRQKSCVKTKNQSAYRFINQNDIGLNCGCLIMFFSILLQQHPNQQSKRA